MCDLILCFIRHWFSCPSGHYLCLYCVIWLPVFSNTNFSPSTVQISQVSLYLWHFVSVEEQRIAQNLKILLMCKGKVSWKTWLLTAPGIYTCILRSFCCSRSYFLCNSTTSVLRWDVSEAISLPNMVARLPLALEVVFSMVSICRNSYTSTRNRQNVNWLKSCNILLTVIEGAYKHVHEWIFFKGV